MARKKAKLPVKFGRVSIGDKDTVRLGFKFSRANLDVAEADALLTGAKLTVDARITDGQAELPMEGALPQIQSVADVAHLGVSTDGISAGLSFGRKDVDVEILCDFPGKEGEMVLTRIGSMSQAKDGADDEA